MNTLEVLPESQEPEVTRRFYNPEPEKRQLVIATCILLWSILAYLFMSHFVMMAVQIKGASMSPTLRDGQRYILFRCTYLWRAPRQGEIVVIR
ncbi:MAG TPA: S26 family signal peptidase, partial [Verrucomicrobiae bacterium]|nr:S26 family signal peptidase [Verrucomicrobiae bacterium]